MCKPLRNFDKFEVGHYYVYTGGKELNWTEPMNAVLDYKIHKCLNVCNQETTYYAEFKDVKGCFWDWKNGFDNWVEVESPDAVFEKEDDCLVFLKFSKQWKIYPLHNTDYISRKNIYDNSFCVYYILKRKNKKEEPITKSKNVCPHCGSDKLLFKSIYHGKKERIDFQGQCLSCSQPFKIEKKVTEEGKSTLISFWDSNAGGDPYKFSEVIKKNLDDFDAKENVPRETPDIQTHSHNSQFFSTGTSIKMSLGAIQSDLNLHPIWLKAKALSEWMEFWTDKIKDVDKKDNVFKKYIRTKKYMKFVKEKK